MADKASERSREGTAWETIMVNDQTASDQVTTDQTANESVDIEFDIVLASASPRRRELLEQAGVAFVVRTPQTPVDETLEPDDLLDPHEAAKKLAERKAGAVVQEVLSEKYQGYAAVIGSDTMVVCDGRIFGKPANLSDAKHMLRQLSGRTHEVVTAVSVWLLAAPTVEDVSLGFRTFTDATRVRFHELSDDDIAAYLREGESFDKAGAYAIQGKGERLVAGIDGNMSTVIGLPIERLLNDFPDIFAAKHSNHV
ncbi:nucleoside triphosphate pyrophosphatase [Adlercreutzia sp. ZJ138]|uniref:Maf family protein n=1 Tax=Adlercreutzia sp. ZJ138 TaxID=2709405 RepID=UPI001F14C25C|nr:Maf family protein [Adlercreutzia sp. ZJ138]